MLAWSCERSCGGTGAGAFLTCPASETHSTELADGAFAFGIRWRLGLPTTSPGLTCRVPCRARGRLCGAPLDSLSDHAAICRCGGYKILRHSRIVACLRGLLRESGARVEPTEVSVAAWRAANGTDARLEVCYTASGVRRFADVTVRHARAGRYWRQAAAEDGFAAAVGERVHAPFPSRRLTRPSRAVAGAGV